MKNMNVILFCMLMAFVSALLGCDRRDAALTVDQFVEKGRQFYAEGKVDDAIGSLKKAIKLKPTSSELHYELGVMYYEEWRKSRDIAQKKILAHIFAGRPDKASQSKDNEKLLIQYGYKKEYYGLAMSEFSEVLRRDPSNWSAQYYLAADLFNNKKYEQAIAAFKKIVQIKPDFANSYSFIGHSYLRIGNYQLAVEMLQKASDLDPSAYHYYLLGVAYKKMNNWKKVEEIAKKLKVMDDYYYNRLLLQGGDLGDLED